MAWYLRHISDGGMPHSLAPFCQRDATTGKSCWAANATMPAGSPSRRARLLTNRLTKRKSPGSKWSAYTATDQKNTCLGDVTSMSEVLISH